MVETTKWPPPVGVQPGRSLVGAHGVLLARVIQRKVAADKRWLMIDAGMNDLMRPALYQARHRIVPTVMAEGAALAAMVRNRTARWLLFALMALAGDVGCAGGPTLAGLVSDACGGALRAGILAAVIFPLLMLLCVLLMQKKAR